MNGSGERDRGRGKGKGQQAAKSPFPYSSLTQFMRKAKSGDFTTGDTWHSNHAALATKNFHPPLPPPLPFFVAAVGRDSGARAAAVVVVVHFLIMTSRAREHFRGK